MRLLSTSIRYLVVAACVVALNACSLIEEPKDKGIYHYWEGLPNSYVRVGNANFDFALERVMRNGKNVQIVFSITNASDKTYSDCSIFGPDVSPCAYDDRNNEYTLSIPSKVHSGMCGFMDGEQFGVYGWGFNFNFPPGETRVCTITFDNMSSMAQMVRIPLYLNTRTTSGVYDELNLIHLHWIPIPEGEYNSLSPIK